MYEEKCEMRGYFKYLKNCDINEGVNSLCNSKKQQGGGTQLITKHTYFITITANSNISKISSYKLSRASRFEVEVILKYLKSPIQL